MAHHNRFGPAPPLMATVSPQTVLVGQMVVCVVSLLILQPPFVMAPPVGGLGPTMSLSRILALSLAATSATWVLHASGVTPLDSFQGACEVMYRVSRV